MNWPDFSIGVIAGIVFMIIVGIIALVVLIRSAS